MEASGFVRTSLRDFLHVIFKRKSQILLFFLITFCTVVVGTFIVKPTYRATAQILVKIGRESVYVPATGSVQPVINFKSEERINSEIEILKSPSLAEKKDLLTKYTDQNRLVRNVRDEIEVVQQKLTRHETKRYGKTRSGANPVYQHLQEELFRNRADLKSLNAKSKAQNQQLADLQKELDALNQIEVLHNQLEQEVAVDRQNYRLYLTKFEESRISNAMDTEKITSVSLIEPAQTPLKPISPKKLLNLVLGLFLGAFGGLGLAFFLEYLDDSLETIEDVEERLQLPVLASSWS